MNKITNISTNGAICSSDINIKENIRPIENEKLRLASAIRKVAFNFKDDETKRTVYGVIAQEIEKLGLNELVHIKEDGTKAVDYTSLTVLMIEVFSKEIVKLINDVNELKEKIKEKTE